MENLKSIKKILFDMDNNLTEAECAIEKGKFQSIQLYNDFSIEKTEFQKVYDWENGRIMSEILLDYIAETEKKLGAVREFFNILWEMKKEKEAPQDKTVIPAGADGQQYKDEIAKLLNELDTRRLRNAWLFISVMAGRCD